MKPLYRARTFQVAARAAIFVGEFYNDSTKFVRYSLETLLQHVNLFRHYYGFKECDILGDGCIEHPFYPPLVEHCRSIGLGPSVVTHGFPQPYTQDIEAAGLQDWVVSLHGGSASSHDAIIGDAGSFDRLVRGLHLVQRPVRFSTMLTKDNYKDLPWKVLADQPPTVWNLLGYNPLYGWDGAHKIETQTSYSEMGPYIAEAIVQLEEAGWEVNVRYWPLCIAEKFHFAENVCGYHQLPFDPWAWSLNMLNHVPMEQVEAEGGWYESERSRATMMMHDRKAGDCGKCSYRAVCDKLPIEYQKVYGLDELTAVEGSFAHDPLLFQKKRSQPKGNQHP